MIPRVLACMCASNRARVRYIYFLSRKIKLYRGRVTSMHADVSTCTFSVSKRHCDTCAPRHNLSHIRLMHGKLTLRASDTIQLHIRSVLYNT